jgi:uncharacterized protein (DUF1684 family)
VNERDVLDLLDWKRRIFSLYEDVRSSNDPAESWVHWREVRDDMFLRHPQSPLPDEARESFEGLPFFAYDAALRVEAELAGVEERSYEIATSGDTTMSFTRFATAALELAGTLAELEVYWLEAYGGGIFLPFRDATSGSTTYGAGRYLLDTVKGADLGTNEGRLILDFNFAYNPSCAYDPRWVCPLAPPPNRIELPIEAGERYGG